MPLPNLPTYRDSPEIHADWLEWSCLREVDHYVAWADHLRDIGMLGGEGEDEADFDLGQKSERLEIFLNDVRSELSERERACGRESYPFRVEEEGIAHIPVGEGGVYEFLLLLTFFGPQAGPDPTQGAPLFESLALEALLAYLGRNDSLSCGQRFGAPRSSDVKGFRKAVDGLCRSLGEGEGCRSEPDIKRKQDAHLDLVAWKAFPDGGSAKLILFGQCGAGEDWFKKIHELQPREWCQLYLRTPPTMIPAKSLFIPRRIEPIRWREAAVYGGILFDRCRIASLASEPEAELKERIASWSHFVRERAYP